MKHICMFSGGAASAYMSWLVAQEHPNDTILFHTPTYSEHPDADRFREQVAKYIGLPITVQADGRNIWQLIEDNHCIPSDRMPFCTRILKIEQTDKFLKTITGDYTLYYGYGIKEWRRVQKALARSESVGRKIEFPIFERGIHDDTNKHTITNGWGICLPEPYKHLKHNNCIPCWKGGKGHFRAVWRYYPDKFWQAVEAEERWGYNVFEGEPLRELAAQWGQGGKQIELDDNDTRPCMCSF